MILSILSSASMNHVQAVPLFGHFIVVISGRRGLTARGGAAGDGFSCRAGTAAPCAVVVDVTMACTLCSCERVWCGRHTVDISEGHDEGAYGRGLVVRGMS